MKPTHSKCVCFLKVLFPFDFKRDYFSPGQVAQLVGIASHGPKGCRFNPWSYIRVHTEGNRLMFLSNIDVLSLSLSLSLSQVNEHILG